MSDRTTRPTEVEVALGNLKQLRGTVEGKLSQAQNDLDELESQVNALDEAINTLEGVY